MIAESRSHRQIEAIAFLVHYINLTLLLRERPFMTDLYSHLGKKRISVIFGDRHSFFTRVIVKTGHKMNFPTMFG